MTENRGLIHLYHGDGKGKTTAATGLAVRALGRGLRVLVVQLLKDGSSGEIRLLERMGKELSLPITVLADQTRGFTFTMTDQDKKALGQRQTALLEDAFERCRQGGVELLVLDELLHVLHMGMVEEQLVLDFLQSKPQGLEVVMTGRGPSDALLAAADYVTEMKKIKHPYDRGIPGREGIER